MPRKLPTPNPDLTIELSEAGPLPPWSVAARMDGMRDKLIQLRHKLRRRGLDLTTAEVARGAFAAAEVPRE